MTVQELINQLTIACGGDKSKQVRGWASIEEGRGSVGDSNCQIKTSQDQSSGQVVIQLYGTLESETGWEF